MNIVILDGYAANPNDFSWEPLENFGSLTVYERTKPEEVIARAKDAEILIINKINMTDEVIAQLPKLKYIGILATGYNNIDTESAHKHGIVVCNIPSYSTESVVQMTFAHILNITNQVAHYANQDRATGEAADLKWTKNPDFCYWDTPLPEIAGKTLGICGSRLWPSCRRVHVERRNQSAQWHQKGLISQSAAQLFRHSVTALSARKQQHPLLQLGEYRQDEARSYTYQHCPWRPC